MARNSWLLLLAAACACAQQTANVSGKVTNSVTGAPIVRAHVTLSGARNFGAMTDGDGKFSITGIAPGSYTYKAERVGFLSEDWRRGMGVDVKAGENSLDSKLSPTASISGHVLDADGQPMQLAQITAVGADDDHSSTTDNKGRYRIGGLAPGKYRVLANPPSATREIRTDGSQPVYYRATYYSSPLELEAGADVSGIDVPLLTKTMVKISGSILDIPPGAKDVAVEINSDPTANSSNGFALPAAIDGSFEFWGLDPGTYRLYGQTADGLRSAAVAVEVGATNIEHLEFRLLAPFDVVGHVEYEDDRARQASKVEQEGPPRFQRAVFLDDELGGNYLRTQIGDDDSFRLEHLWPGIYDATVIFGHSFVRSVRLGNVQSDDGKFDLRSGPHGDSLTFTLSADWAEISGTVSDGNGPVAGATVEIVQERVSRGEQTDGNGHFSIRDVRPGTYQLVAGDDRLNDLFRDTDALEDYKEGIVTVDVHPGDKITQDLRQVRPAK